MGVTATLEPLTIGILPGEITPAPPVNVAESVVPLPLVIVLAPALKAEIAGAATTEREVTALVLAGSVAELLTRRVYLSALLTVAAGRRTFGKVPPLARIMVALEIAVPVVLSRTSLPPSSFSDATATLERIGMEKLRAPRLPFVMVALAGAVTANVPVMPGTGTTVTVTLAGCPPFPV